VTGRPPLGVAGTYDVRLWLARPVADAYRTCQFFLGLSIGRREDIDAMVAATPRRAGKKR
jgi:hypothetical protein